MSCPLSSIHVKSVLFLLITFSSFFFNDPATTEIYTLSLHDALPISRESGRRACACRRSTAARGARPCARRARSEEHTSELQSRRDLVCRLLLEKKKNQRRGFDPVGERPASADIRRGGVYSRAYLRIS